MPSYFTHTVEVKNFERLTIDGLHEERAGTNPVIYLHKGKGEIINRVSSNVKNKKLVLIDNED